MKKIVDYRKLLGVTKEAELQELKTVYRGMMKTWHPDKFQESPEEKLEAEEKSKTIIEAYHFLVSIAPETLDQSSELINADSPGRFARRHIFNTFVYRSVNKLVANG